MEKGDRIIHEREDPCWEIETRINETVQESQGRNKIGKYPPTTLLQQTVTEIRIS